MFHSNGAAPCDHCGDLQGLSFLLAIEQLLELFPKKKKVASGEFSYMCTDSMVLSRFLRLDCRCSPRQCSIHTLEPNLGIAGFCVLSTICRLLYAFWHTHTASLCSCGVEAQYESLWLKLLNHYLSLRQPLNTRLLCRLVGLVSVCKWIVSSAFIAHLQALDMQL